MRSVKDLPVTSAPATDFVNLVAGSTPGTFQYKPMLGSEALAAPRSTNVMLFGDQGSGKTYSVIHLLQHGYKVYYVLTDYAGSGVDTIFNWLQDNPDDGHAKNLRIIDMTKFESSNGQSWRAFQNFIENPYKADPGLLEFDPDIVFWDGGSSFQQSDLEDYIGSLDPVRSGGKSVSEAREEGLWLEQADWGMIKNGTLKPLIRFLKLHNTVTGKPWSKIVTFLEEDKPEYKDGKKIDGSEKVGPLLHGAARKIASAGFSIALQSKKVNFGKDGDKHTFVSRGNALMIKDRGFKLPESMPGDLGDIWDKYIAPRLGIKVSETEAKQGASK